MRYIINQTSPTNFQVYDTKENAIIKGEWKTEEEVHIGFGRYLWREQMIRELVKNHNVDRESLNSLTFDNVLKLYEDKSE